MNSQDQVFQSSMQLWNHIDTPLHQSTNLFSQKFKESQEFESINTCSHHPQKKVKYLLHKDAVTIEKLCTKCAVQFAQQGYKIEEIQADDARKKQTDAFIQQLLETKNEIDNVHSHLITNEANIKKFYNDQYTSVVKVFGNVEKQLNICKSGLLATITQQLWNQLNITNQMKVQAKQVEHQLSTYVNDIKTNYDKIVHSINTLPYNQIMGGYSSKLFKLQQCLKNIQDKKIIYKSYEGTPKHLEQVLQDLSIFIEREIPHRNRESTRSSSEQKLCKSGEKEKRHQSQPNSKDVRSFDNSEKRTTQTFKITEESIEEWMENSNSKQRHTEPAEKITSPNILGQKQIKKQLPPSRASLKQEASQAMLDKLFSEFQEIKNNRMTKKQSKTPELGKKVATQTTFSTKLSPKFLYKNYYK